MTFSNTIRTYMLFIIGLVASHSVVYGGQDIDDQAGLFHKYHEENYEELVYVQTDKSYYLTGERIRIKVNCLEKSTSKFSRLSKVAYVELLDSNNLPHIQTKIELVNGTGYGDVFIPTNINSGNFVLRSYTRWMRNYGPESFFHSGIAIINPFKRLGLKPTPASTDISIQFFPESNVLIDSVMTKVVFDIQNGNNEPSAYSGKLISNDSVIVLEFSSFQAGIGSFEFIPDITHDYHVEIQHSDESISKHSFLPIEEKGFSFRVNKRASDLKLEIFCNEPEIVGPSDVLFLMIHQNGRIIGKDNVQLLDGTASFQIENQSIKDGITTMTLFSSNGKFLGQKQLLSPYNDSKQEVKISKHEFQQREKAVIDWSDFLPQASVETANISISVSTYHEDFNIPQLTMDDYLLVSNSLNSQIFRLGKIFEGNATDVSTIVNDLLIAYANVDTSWLETSQKQKVLVPEYRAQLITGKVTNKITKEPEFGLNTYISVVGKNIRFNSTRSKNDGTLIFEMENLYGSNELVAQTDYTQDTIYNIEIDNPFSTEHLDVEFPAFNINEQLKDWIKHQSQFMQVRNAYSRYEKKLPLLHVTDTTAFYIEPDSRYFLDDFTRFIVMEEVMREYVSGVNVRKNQDGFHFMVVDLVRNEVFSENPLMLLDGVPIFDADEIIALDPLNIEKIETIKRRFHKGYLDCFGIVNFTSYAGNLGGYDLNEHALVIKYDGLQKKKQYSFPEYNSAQEKRSTSPDFRDVLYWNPQVQLQEQDKNSVEFYTSDETNTYQIVVNSITEDGKVSSGKTLFTVLPDSNN